MTRQLKLSGRSTVYCTGGHETRNNLTNCTRRKVTATQPRHSNTELTDMGATGQHLHPRIVKRILGREYVGRGRSGHLYHIVGSGRVPSTSHGFRPGSRIG